MNGNQRSAAYCLPATQVLAAPVARAAGKPICEHDGDGQLGLCVSNGEGMCLARRAVGVAWLTWLLRVGEPGRVIAIGIRSHSVWDLLCVTVWRSTLPGALDLSCGVEGALVAWWVMSGQGLGQTRCMSME